MVLSLSQLSAVPTEIACETNESRKALRVGAAGLGDVRQDER